MFTMNEQPKLKPSLRMVVLGLTAFWVTFAFTMAAMETATHDGAKTPANAGNAPQEPTGANETNRANETAGEGHGAAGEPHDPPTAAPRPEWEPEPQPTPETEIARQGPARAALDVPVEVDTPTLQNQEPSVIESVAEATEPVQAVVESGGDQG